jgi:polyglycine hydrolase-like protein
MSLLDEPATSVARAEVQRHISAVVATSEAHAELVANAIRNAYALGKVTLGGLTPLNVPIGGVFTLAQYQSPFKYQGDRGTCWAFAGAAALEAAYKRKYGLNIDVSEEYIFHIGKSFALNRDASGNVVTPVENNSSRDEGAGCADVVQKVTENAVPGEDFAPYLKTQGNLTDILGVLGYGGPQFLQTQEDYDALEFCEQHIPLIARVNARYRSTDFGTLGANPTVQAIENTLLAEHEVVCDVNHKTDPVGGHTLLLIGFDQNKRVFFAKNHWDENKFIEIAYDNDPNWTITSGWYIKDVVDPTYVQSEACWLGNWWLTIGGQTVRLLLRRAEDFASPKQPTKLGTVYLADGPHDVNGHFTNGGDGLRMFIAPTTAPVPPGTLQGQRIDAQLNFADIYNASGVTGTGQLVTLSRFATRFAALWEHDDGTTAWQARHGMDAKTYQQTFDTLVHRGFRLTSVNGYSEGVDARYNAIWEKRGGGAWEARHGLTAAAYQATFDALVAKGMRLTDVSGYAINGVARYAAIWEELPPVDWQARHGLTPAEFQQTFNTLAADGYVMVRVSAYRVNVTIQFAAIWEKQGNVTWEAHHGLTGLEYQDTFDKLVAAGSRLAWVDGYSDTGIARYASIWRHEPSGPWHARHGLDAARYQKAFDDLHAAGFRPVQVSGYGDGFYPA